ncbi:MAG: type III secretion system export apparatus subunit SctR [Polyangiales bacterium]
MSGGSPLVGYGALVALSLLPLVFMVCTSFAKISVVLSILRNALGAGQVPSGMIVAALSALLSLYVMAPVGERMWTAAMPHFAGFDAEAPLDAARAEALLEGAEQGLGPLRQFLERHSGRRETALFLDLARRSRPAESRASVQPTDLLVVLPSFLVTELSEAFQIGFLVFVPFLVIDVVVANVLLALGMHMLSPTTISMPFKLLLFVAVDGWYLLARALVMGYVA